MNAPATPQAVPSWLPPGLCMLRCPPYQLHQLPMRTRLLGRTCPLSHCCLHIPPRQGQLLVYAPNQLIRPTQLLHIERLGRGARWPDKGWNPPAHYPVNRDGIWYRNWQPKDWYGSPGGGFIANSPMVYQPTDTTQLGFSYAKVPTWQSIRMVPPTPCPDHFHARVCVPRPHACMLPDGCPAGTPCRNRQFQSGGHGVPGSSTCPSCQQGHAFNAPMTQPYAAAAATSRPSV